MDESSPLATVNTSNYQSPYYCESTNSCSSNSSFINVFDEHYDNMEDDPPPPPPPQQQQQREVEVEEAGLSLDFQRIINDYSIQAIRDRLRTTTTTQSVVSSDEDLGKEEEEEVDDNDDPMKLLLVTTSASSNEENYKDENDDDADYYRDMLIIREDYGTINGCRKTATTTRINNHSRNWKDREKERHNHHQQQRQHHDHHRSSSSSNIEGYYTGRTCTRWILTIVIGLFMGIAAIAIVNLTETIVEWRSEKLEMIWSWSKEEESSTARGGGDKLVLPIFYILFNLCLAIISASMTLYICPQASGSGIPEVKAYLNGVRIYKFGRWSLFSVKIVATILSVSSGLVCGPEGPFIHIGAILGLGVTKIPSLTQTWNQRYKQYCGGFLPPPSLQRRLGLLNDKLWEWINFDLAHFATEAERRDLVSIGAAVGFSACFGAPIGGLLFALEEASSFFPDPLLLRTLAATSIATFILAVHHGSLSMFSVISLDAYHAPDTNFLSNFEEIPLYVVNGAVGGLMGGCFVICWKHVQERRKALFSSVSSKTKRRLQLTEVAILSLITSFLNYYWSSQGWACKSKKIFRQDFSHEAWEVPHLLCEHRSHRNEVAGILFGGRDAPIRAILLNPEQFDSRTLLAVGLSFLPLMMLTLGVSLPSGIFMPTFLIGCSLGGFVGVKYKELLPNHNLAPSTFALLGAAALLTGIQRSTVSLCVILVEGTGQVKLLIPVIITVVVARYVGDRIIPEGLYEIAIELRDYSFLEHKEDKLDDIYQVKQVMSAPPRCLRQRERALSISRLLESCTHNGFPVIDDGGKFLGLVRRDQLVALLECGVFMSNEELLDYETSDNDETNHQSSSSLTSSADRFSHQRRSPLPGSTQSPLMNLAYHIKDDRYEHIADNRSSRHLNKIEDDDNVAWTANFRESVKKLDMEGLPAEISDQIKLGMHHHSTATRYAWVRRTSAGQIGVRLNPIYCMQYVHVAAVMNRGAHTVTEFCPISTAKNMFTTLGLRHLVVLGGDTGGKVVGVLSRSNFLQKNINRKCRHGSE